MPCIIYMIHFVQHFLCDILQLFHTFHSVYCHTLHIFSIEFMQPSYFLGDFIQNNARRYDIFSIRFSIFNVLYCILLHNILRLITSYSIYILYIFNITLQLLFNILKVKIKIRRLNHIHLLI